MFRGAFGAIETDSASEMHVAFSDGSSATLLQSSRLELSSDRRFFRLHHGAVRFRGVAAVAAVQWAARELGADRLEILHHSTSADETGDRSSVVGYGAAAVLKH